MPGPMLPSNSFSLPSGVRTVEAVSVARASPRGKNELIYEMAPTSSLRIWRSCLPEGTLGKDS
jgi:hypothetical protein